VEPVVKKGDRVIVDTSGWSAQSRQRARITRVGADSYGLTWETGELEGREANVARGHLTVVEVLSPPGGPPQGVDGH
jgi:hypothetical protein